MSITDAGQKPVKWWQLVTVVIAVLALVFELGVFVRDEQAVVALANKNTTHIERLTESINKLFVITARHEIRLENLESRREGPP